MDKANPQKTQSRRANTPGSSSSQGPDLDKVSADLLKKLPPQSLEAEQAVLGGVFVKNSVFHTLTDIISEDDFYFPANRTIYSTFTELYRRSEPIDLVTVAEELKRADQLDKVGGALYLAELREASVVNASNAEFHARIVRNKAVQRELISASTNIIANCFEGSQDVGTLMDEAEQSVFAISERTTGATFQTSKDLVNKVYDEMTSRYDRGGELITGIPTGYNGLNELTAGFQRSDLIILAARPSMGKTAFALNMAMRTAVQEQTPTAIFSLEMSSEQLMQRMLCAWGKVNLKNLRTGFLTDEDWLRLQDAADALSGAPIYIDDTPALGTLEMRARCRRLKMEKGLDLVVVDYLQLMRASRRIDSREQEISEISRTLKALAKEINVPVMALSQLNRKVEERTNKRPMLSDLRESGAIEQDADVIMFIYRDEVYNKKDDNPKQGVAEIIIGKQRNGPLGVVELAFVKHCTAFEELFDQGGPSEATDMQG